jgi:hypothetical protein
LESRATHDCTRKISNFPEANISKTSTAPGQEGSVVEASTVPIAMFKESQRQCEILRDQVLRLKENLQDAQDFIFSLQPSQQILTEMEGTADFISLCASVEAWVDSRLRESLDDMVVTKGKVPLKASQVLLSLIPYPGEKAFEYPQTDEYNITAAILKFLCDTIFLKNFYCPIGALETKCLLSVERSMRSLEPRRGQFTCFFCLLH